MTELDEIWSRMLADASENAKASGRHDVAAYLTLKASNDAIRRAGVGWLLETLTEFAATTDRGGHLVKIERKEPHNFHFRGANMVGISISFRYGLRCLTVEAGWTRTPADGFMRGGGMAFARFKHFGMAEANLDVGLFGTSATPAWRAMRNDEVGGDIHSQHLRRHIDVLVSD